MQMDPKHWNPNMQVDGYLEVPAAQKEVDLGILHFLQVLERRIDLVELSMHAALDRYLIRSKSKTTEGQTLMFNRINLK